MKSFRVFSVGGRVQATKESAAPGRGLYDLAAEESILINPLLTQSLMDGSDFTFQPSSKVFKFFFYYSIIMVIITPLFLYFIFLFIIILFSLSKL